MPPKTKATKIIDTPPLTSGAGGVSSNSTDNVVPPANPTVDAPYNLALTTVTIYSSAAPMAAIDAIWDRPLSAVPMSYLIQVSTASTFTASGTITATTPAGGITSAHIEGLLPGVLYYVRVRANIPGVSTAWSSMSPLVTGQNQITTATDTAAAGVPTSPAAAWIGTGDLRITWVNPTNANFKDVKIVIRASSGGTIWRTDYSKAQSYVYTWAMNDADTSHAPDSSLYVELQSRTFSDVLSSTVNTGLVTKAVPATPSGLTQSWSGDTGTAGPDLTVSWTAQSDAASYVLTLDGVARRVYANTYTLTLDANRAQHSGTPDPVVTYSLTAADDFNQVSTAVSGTATNAAPAAPTATLTQGVVSGLYAIVTSTPPADFWRYEFVFKRDGTTVATVPSASSTQRYEMTAAADEGFHSWTVVIRQEDLFAQFSSTVTPSAVAFEALTLGGLRAQARYTDSEATAPATLKAALADGVTTSGGISYNP